MKYRSFNRKSHQKKKEKNGVKLKKKKKKFEVVANGPGRSG